MILGPLFFAMARVSTFEGPRGFTSARGFFFQSGDVDSLASQVAALLGQPALRQRMGVDARARVVQLFSLDACVARTADLLQRISMRSTLPHGMRPRFAARRT